MMSGAATYLLEVNFGLAFLLLAYALLPGHRTDFRVKRLTLLLALLTAFIFPLFHIAGSDTTFVALTYIVPEQWYTGAVKTEGQLPVMNDAILVLLIVYGTGVVFFLFRFLRGVFMLARLVWRYPSNTVGKLRVVESEENIPSFSFGRFIFIGQVNNLSADEKTHILLHESAHARSWHTLDRILLAIVEILFWYNPVIQVYKRLLIRLHEFEADACVIRSASVDTYCNLLARVSLLYAGIPLTSSFGNLTVQRIAMLRSLPRKIRAWHVVVLLSLVGVFFYLVALDHSMPHAVEDLASSNAPITTVADEAPMYYQNGYAGLSEFIQANLRYPSESRSKGEEGSVFTSFVVKPDGTITDVKTIKGVSPALDAEARRIVEMTRWTPGVTKGKATSVRLVLPIKFKIDY